MEMNRMLMCRERPVMEFRYFPTGGYALMAGEIFDRERVPFGMWVDGHPEPTGESITRWWRSRGVPMTRDGIRTALAGMGIPLASDLLDRSLGLSLSDQYWARPLDRDDVQWADLNFFHNDFDEQLGRALFYGNSSRVADVNTPDVTSAGDLPKRWVITPDGTRELIKAGRSGQEPDNEVIASRVADLLGMAHVEYRVGHAQGKRVCICPDMVTDREELIPGGQLMPLFRKASDEERKAAWIDACERAGADRDAIVGATDDFLLLDYLLRNTDRHYNNFGLIRDVETLAVSPAPIFDTGESLFNGMDLEMMDNDDYPAKPFWLDDAGEKPNARWQLSLIEDWDRWDLTVLDAVPDIVRDQLSTNSRLPERIVGRVAELVCQRADEVRRMLR